MKTVLLPWLGIVLGLWSIEVSNVRGVKIEWGKFGNWTECDVTCGGGIKSRMKRCITPGISEEKCIKTRVRGCNKQPCPESEIKLKWGKWNKWTRCSVTCGGGTKTRTKLCTTPEIGKDICTKTAEKKCNQTPCRETEPTADPEGMPGTVPVGEPTGNPEPTSDSADYTKPMGEPTPGQPEPMPEKEPKMTKWTVWTLCSAKCGGGMQYRTRECIDPDEDSECEQAQSAPCNTFPCLGTIISTPEGFAEVASLPFGELTPSPEPVSEKGPQMTDWNAWTACSAVCEGGIRYRTRECISPVDNADCEQAQSETCNTFPCLGLDRPTPESFVEPEPTSTPEESPTSTDVSPEGEPTQSYAKTDKSYTTPMSDDDIVKRGPLMTEWNEWTSCSAVCEGGTRYRTRECISPVVNADCEQVQSETCNTFPCLSLDRPTPEGFAESEPTSTPEDSPPSTDVSPEGEPTQSPTANSKTSYTTSMSNKDLRIRRPLMTEWNAWTACDALCGAGARYRTRECISPVADCEQVQGEICNTSPCFGFDRPSPEGFAESEPTSTPEESPPSTDVSPEGEPTQSQTLTSKTSYTTSMSDKHLRIRGPLMTQWNAWTACDALCERGTRYRTRECISPVDNAECEQVQSEICNTFPCFGFDRPSPEGFAESEPTSMPEKSPSRTDATQEGEPTQSYRAHKKSASYTATMSDKELRKRKKKMKRICGPSRIRTSTHVVQTAISPEYPKSYPENLDCIWILISPKRTRVKIQVQDFAMGKGDTLTLIEGRHGDKSYSDSNVIATLHGKVRNGTEYRSIGRFMTVKLRTTENEGGRYSFKLSTTKAEHDEDVNNPETAPEVATWVDFMRLMMKHFYDDM